MSESRFAQSGTRSGVVAGVLLATTLLVTVQALLMAVVDPVDLYGPGARAVLPSGGAAVPGSRALDAATVLALEELPLLETAVAQTFAFTVVNGQPVVVRGAHLEELLSLHDARLVDGSIDGERPVLLVGVDLARRMDFSVGDAVLLPSSGGVDLLRLEVAGLVAAPTGISDELLVDRATGERLSGLRTGQAHLVEVRAEEEAAFEEWLSQTQTAPTLRVVSPAVARAGEPIDVRVLSAYGEPVAGAVARAGSETVRADASGRLTVDAPFGTRTWRVEAPRHAPTEFTLRGVGPEAGAVVTALRAEPDFPRPGRAFDVHIDVENFADDPRQALIVLEVDGAPITNVTADVEPRERQTLVLNVAGMDAGEYTLQAGGARAEVVVATPEALQAQFRLANAAGLRSASETDALDSLFGSIALAATLIGALAFSLCVLGNGALLTRYLGVQAPELKLLRGLGAARIQVHAFVFRTIGLRAIAAALGGIVTGAALSEAVTRSGAWTMFGHSIQLRWTPGESLLLVGICLASVVLPLVVATELFLRRYETASSLPRSVAPPTTAAIAHPMSSTRRGTMAAATLLLLLAALAIRSWPLMVSPLPYNVDGFSLAATAETFLRTASWNPWEYESSRPGAFMVLALASATTSVAPLPLAQPLFSLIGAAAAVATTYFVARAAGPRAALISMPVAALLGSFVYYSAAVMKQATGYVLLPLVLALLLVRPTRRSTLLGAGMLFLLPLFHHFVAFLALAALALATVAQAAAAGAGTLTRGRLATLGAAAGWSLAWTYTVREPLGETWSLAVDNAPLYAALFTLTALAVHVVAARPPRIDRARLALILPPLLGAAVVAANAATPFFEGGYRTPMPILLGLLPYALVTATAGAGLARVLTNGRADVRALTLGLLGSVLAFLAFTLLRGLDAWSFYLAQRTVDVVVPVIALGYGVAAAEWLSRWRRSTRWRSATPALVVLLLLLPALTLPLAIADSPNAGFGNQITSPEYAAIDWTARHAAGPIATDTRLGYPLRLDDQLSVTTTLPYDLSQGYSPPAGLSMTAASWGTHGGELKPLGTFPVDLRPLSARCAALYSTGEAHVLRC